MKTEDIDRRIGMPDIDAEWAAFERNVIEGESRHHLRGPSRIAAIIALVLGVSLTALASVYYIRVVIPARRASTVAVPPSTRDTIVLQTAQADTAAVFFFDNMEMQEIARTLGDYYGVKPVFRDEKLKTIRLYANISKEKSLDEVVALLNNFKKVKLSVSNGYLIIENRNVK